MSAYEDLVSYLRQSRVLLSCEQALTWDQETQMPHEAAALRAEQLSVLTGITHRRGTADELGELLERADDEVGDGDSPEGAVVREARRDFDRHKKVPAELMEEKVHTTSLARQTWIAARKADDFSIFQPTLEHIVDIMRRFADALGYDDHPYDALVAEYEPGETAASLKELIVPLGERVADLLGRILDTGRHPDSSILHRRYPIRAQEDLSRFGAERLGFNFSRGRLDVTAHPFCTGQGPLDVRLTTRYDERNVADAFYSTLHEVGHGIYEQGLPLERFGTPLGEACSFGIHESQSRMWENHVGRSRAYWLWLLPHLRERFPESTEGATPEDFYRAINDVRPSLIRVDADEVTYDLHIAIRYQLEEQLIAGDLEVADIPEAWNAGYKKLLRIDPPSNADGCLQDVHWSAGLFGYFPTYSLGNIYAAQIFDKADEDLGGIHAQFGRGEFRPLRNWLNENIHSHGRRYRPRALVERTTGKKPTIEPMMGYLEAKFGELYAL
ncbi:MAG: carboxypeptidase M32 [Planctomycetota bacterium]|jgi:carboxypeptidase Taq